MTKGSPEDSLPVEVRHAIAPIASGWKVPFLKMAFKLLGNAVDHDVMVDMSDKHDTLVGRALVSKRMAEAVAERLAKDPEEVERAISRFYSEQVRKQENLETIVVDTAHEVAALEYKPVAGEDGGSGKEAPSEISDDWRAKFANYAGDVSEPEMRKLWARVLAGEFRRPGSFSYRTMRLLAELDKQTAQIFAEVAENCIDREILYLDEKPWNRGPPFDKLQRLVAFDLLQDSKRSISMFLEKDAHGRFFIHGRNMAAVVLAPKGPPRVDIPIFRLTPSGKELFTLLPSRSPEAILERVAQNNKGMFGAESKCELAAKISVGGTEGYSPIRTLWDNLAADAPE